VQARRFEAQQAFRLLGRLWILEGVFYDVYAGRGIAGEHSNLGAPGSQTLMDIFFRRHNYDCRFGQRHNSRQGTP
jgi:hypothetical protein